MTTTTMTVGATILFQSSSSVGDFAKTYVADNTANDLAALGLRAVNFNLPLLLESEAAARRGEHHPLREALDRIRNRRRGG